ncbi:type I polyketide synthase [Tsukamurella sp. 8F]|uniref:type I polyketide synthase n=1 Tax=unclassified Tsukamurella TaxID=2633480 RepID=UPI0023B8A102|nr:MULTISPECIES: type I polyketide synthase [unclassified Tsukamurella]MDF0531690.1 type I polyketide synthase [Tsukamurella sp. 8J]MDF0588936.1 type I polyketide synthase [Tsukamurella sp. 8F]
MIEQKGRMDRPEPLAIVGIGCHFPGGATTPSKFWDLLCAGVDATSEVPENRWESRKFYDPDSGKLGKMSTTRGGFLDRVDQFDAHFFGIAPREAIWIDPQQRLLLRAAWEAFEDAGQPADQLAGSDTGVFMAGFTLDYNLLQNYGVQSRYELDSHSATGMMSTMLSNRLSYSFDFRGPSLTVDTACSGSLVAVHLAAQSIWNGECSMALAGGASVILAPNMTIAESKGGFLSADGRCKAFDASADGYARGEGAGVVLLKPLSRAQADCDDIYALLVGSAVTQDGRTNGITVPNGDSQAEAMRVACARGGVEPRQVSYVEAHGTGTPLGDPIEATAISSVFAQDPCRDPVLVSSVKTNIGHLEAAAGVAGLIKTALVLKNGQVPGHLHLNEPNPAIDFDELGIRVPAELETLPDEAAPRFAGVNSFGFGGTVSHAVLQSAPALAPQTTDETAPREGTPRLLTLSAKSAPALRDVAASMSDRLLEPGGSLDDIAFSCNVRRTHHEHRLSVVASDAVEVRERLAEFAGGEEHPDVVTGRARVGSTPPKLAFVFTGMGPQWWAMARQLLDSEPVFRDAVQRCDDELRRYTGRSLMSEMLASEDESRMSETEVSQPANFAVQVGLTDLWRARGITPDAVIGHSTGEVAAQYIAGVLSFEDAVKVVYHRSRLQQRTSGQGRMLAVGMTPETLNQAVADAGPLVSVAAINGPSAVTIAGESAALENMADQLETFGVFHRFLDVAVPFHSHYMDPLRAELVDGLQDITPRSATVPLYSTVTGTRINGRAADAEYWWQNVRATVLFASAFSQMVSDGYTHIVEIGPHPVLASSMRELLADGEGLLVPSLRRNGDDHRVLLQSLGALHNHGHRPDWSTLHHPSAKYVKLPTYPWQLETFWNESAEAREDRHYAQVHPLLGQRMNASHHTWELEVSASHPAFLTDHRIQNSTLLPGAAFIEMSLAAGRDVYGLGVGDLSIEDLTFHRALILSDASDARLRTILYESDARVEIASFVALPNGTREWTIHATAKLNLRTAAAGHNELAAVRSECQIQIGRSDFYDQTSEMGFQYGPSFQPVQEIAYGQGIAMGTLEVPTAIADELGDYLFHPSLVDGAFQVLLTAATPADSDATRSTPFLPVGLRRVDVLAPPTRTMVAVAHVVEADDAHIVSDITLSDTDGRILVRLCGFHAQSLQTTTALSTERIDRDLLELQWQKASRNDVDRSAGEEDAAAWLIFADRTGVAAEIAQMLQSDGVRVFTVARNNSGPRDLGTVQDSFSIDPADPEQYKSVVRALNNTPIANVIHLWSLDAPADDGSVDGSALASQDFGSQSVMLLIQAISAELGQLPKVWLATRGAQAVGTGEAPPHIDQAAMWGLARVVGHQEFTSLWGGICDLDPDSTAATQGRALLEEVIHSDGEDQIAFRQDERYILRLSEVSGLKRPFPASMRENGTYLVTGGLGALGLLVARFLVENGARDIALTSRSGLPPRNCWSTVETSHPQRHLIDAVVELESKGARIHVAAVDVADDAQMRAWLDDYYRSGMPPVHGVVHTAGVVSDELLIRMNTADFHRVLRPKIGGGQVLDRLFGDADLDFFVLFSSVGSVIASPGQANYAAGNAYLDALAHHRRSRGLRALSIGWGPWSIGMVKDLDLEQVYARRGIGLITPESGMHILGRLLNQAVPHTVAITVDWEVAQESSFAGNPPPMFSLLGPSGQNGQGDLVGASDAPLRELQSAEPGERFPILVRHLGAMVSAVLGLEVEQVPIDENLNSLGFDSMMALELKRRVEIGLQADVSVLELLQGITITSLAQALMSDLLMPTDAPPADQTTASTAEDHQIDAELDELEQLLASADPSEIEQLLKEVEGGALGAAPGSGS